MRQKFLFISFIGLAISSLSFINGNDTLFVKPANFPEPLYRFNENPLTPEGVELGRLLFYDARLSRDGTISCGSCHQQPSAFTQHGHALSHGIDDLLTQRNSMPLQNLAWLSDFGWDGGVHDLDLFAVSPIQKPNEMAETLPNVLDKLRLDSAYLLLFQKAFGNSEIDTEHFLKAISQFMLTLVSANSRYDKYIRNEGETLNAEELAGLSLFKQKCASCHAGELFTDQTYRNNGLKITNSEDIGRAAISLNYADKYKFRVPSLRNVAQTFPYMHDGRLGTLQEVLSHYETGVQAHAYTDPLLKGGIALSTTEKTQIIAFLNTLTDTQFLKNPAFSETGEAYNEPSVSIGDWTKINFGELDPTLKVTFQEALVSYLDITRAIAKEDGKSAKETADKLLKMLNQIDKSKFSALQKSLYISTIEDLSFDIEHISETESFQHQRDHIGDVGKNLFKLIKAYHANNKPLYYLFCTKANQGRGGYWISETPNSANPFFSTNNKCGAIKEELFNN